MTVTVSPRLSSFRPRPCRQCPLACPQLYAFSRPARRIETGDRCERPWAVRAPTFPVVLRPSRGLFNLEFWAEEAVFRQFVELGGRGSNLDNPVPAKGRRCRIMPLSCGNTSVLFHAVPLGTSGHPVCCHRRCHKPLTQAAPRRKPPLRRVRCSGGGPGDRWQAVDDCDRKCLSTA